MSLLKNQLEQTPIKNNTQSLPELFNAYIDQLKGDLNGLLIAASFIDDNVERFCSIYSQEYVSRVRERVAGMERQLEGYKRLGQNLRFSHVTGFDFRSETERLPIGLAADEYEDPKTKIRFTDRATDLKINDYSSSLQLPIDVDTEAEIVSTILEAIGIPGAEDDRNYYLVKGNSFPVDASIVFRLKEPSAINYFSLDTKSEFPFDIVSLEYYDNGAWTELTELKVNGVADKVELSFPKITCSEIVLNVRLTGCRGTNRTIEYSHQKMAQALVRNPLMFLEFETEGEYTTYVFHLGIESVKAGLRQTRKTGIFVSRPYTFKGLNHFMLEADETGNENVCTEYYLRITSGTQKTLIPVHTKDKTTIREVLKFEDGSATLMFLPAGEVVITPELVFTSLGDKITSNNVLPNTDYIAEYRPYHTDKLFPTLVSGNDDRPFNDYTFTFQQGTYDDLEKSLSFILPEPIQDDVYDLKIVIDGIQLYYEEGFEVLGREAKFTGIDLDVYPQYRNCEFTISARPLGTSISNTGIYYSQDGAVIIGKEQFPGDTQLNLIVIMRDTNIDNDSSEKSVKNVFLYTNSEGTLITNIDKKNE